MKLFYTLGACLLMASGIASADPGHHHGRPVPGRYTYQVVPINVSAALRVCSQATYSTDRAKCKRRASNPRVSWYFDTGALRVCRNRVSHSWLAECVEGITNKRYTIEQENRCAAKFSSRSVRRCLRNSGVEQRPTLRRVVRPRHRHLPPVPRRVPNPRRR